MTNEGTGNGRRLDIAILGVPKAGTSSLHGALAAHPDIVGSNPKETCFFLDPSDPLSGSAGPTLSQDGLDALGTYFHARRGLWLEATTLNLYSDTARDFLMADNSCRLIVALRAPADRIYSNFHYIRDHQCALDPDVDFSTYVDDLIGGRAGKLKDACRTESGFIALSAAADRSDYSKWLAPWRPAYEEGRMRMVLFEAFRDDPGAVLRSLADWLGIDDEFFVTYRAARANKTVPVRLRGIHRWLQRVEPHLPERLRGPAIKRAYRRLQGGSRPQPSVTAADCDALKRLEEHFRGMRASLEEDYRLDLDKWWPSR